MGRFSSWAGVGSARPCRPRLPLSVPIGKAFTGGTLISESCQVIGPRFGEWLKKAPRS